jgi:type II restriction enzyme
MELACDPSIAFAYKSLAQRARVISEGWFSENSYCLACESDRLVRTAPNTVATDFRCSTCGHQYELKTFTRRPPKSLVDGAYASLMARIQSGSAPTLCLLERSESWQVRSLTAIHSSFLTAWVIEQRPPLGEHARRAGWIGCKIRLDLIPSDGELSVIGNGIVHEKAEVRRRFRRFLPLAALPMEQRGWTTLTLAIIRSLGVSSFFLAELYGREQQFAAVYPTNHHIRAKIRQQLQVLRDLGVLSFEGDGLYVLLT